jgi:hypothetical protein
MGSDFSASRSASSRIRWAMKSSLTMILLLVLAQHNAITGAGDISLQMPQAVIARPVLADRFGKILANCFDRGEGRASDVLGLDVQRPGIAVGEQHVLAGGHLPEQRRIAGRRSRPQCSSCGSGHSSNS